MATAHRSGWTSVSLPHDRLITTYETNAAPMPTVMLKVSGMRMSPSSAGKPFLERP